MELHDYIEIIYNIEKSILDDNTVEKIRNEINSIFKYSCTFGYFDIVQWLYNFSKTENLYLNYNNSHYFGGFSGACINGHKNTAEWLYNISKANKVPININAQYDLIFKTTCERGYKETAEWLYSISKIDSNTKFNINENDNQLFRWVCLKGHKNVAEWLYNLSMTDSNTKINISDNDDNVFKIACKYRHNDLVKWLCTLNSNYEIKYYNGTMIPYIKPPSLEHIIEEIKNNNELETIQNHEDCCMICLSNENQYWIKLECNHEICSNCFVIIKQCPYKCKNETTQLNKLKIYQVQ